MSDVMLVIYHHVWPLTSTAVVARQVSKDASGSSHITEKPLILLQNDPRNLSGLIAGTFQHLHNGALRMKLCCH